MSRITAQAKAEQAKRVENKQPEHAGKNGPSKK